MTVNGHVKGDILAFGQEIRVNGPVDGNVRLWCQAVSLNSTVAKNVMVWSQAVELDTKAKVGGTMTIGTQVAQLNGEVDGDILVGAEVVGINGSMGHDVSVHSERLNIGPTAEIKGGTKYEGRRPAEVSAGAKLASPPWSSTSKRGPELQAGPVLLPSPVAVGREPAAGHRADLRGAGILLRCHAGVQEKSDPQWVLARCFLFATPIAAVIVCATIVGLSVGVPVLLLYAIAVYSAKIFVGAWLGEKLLGAGVGVGPALGRLALGLLILRGFSMLPHLGFWIGLIVAAWGLGGIVLALHRRITPQAAAAV